MRHHVSSIRLLTTNSPHFRPLSSTFVHFASATYQLYSITSITFTTTKRSVSYHHQVSSLMGVQNSKPNSTTYAPGLSKPQFDSTMTGAERGREVLTALLEANKSFIAGDSAPQSQLSPPPIRKGLAEHGQQPDLAIVTCADSRVSPEILFGAGLGRVFVIRNAGNVVWGDSVQGSLEYAVAALKIPLVMVLGHSACGAVSGAVATVKNGGGDGGPLAAHLEKIGSVVESCIGGAEEVKDAVLKNVNEGVKNLREGATAVGKAYAAGEIALVGAYYDLHSGEVAVIDE